MSQMRQSSNNTKAPSLVISVLLVAIGAVLFWMVHVHQGISMSLDGSLLYLLVILPLSIGIIMIGIILLLARIVQRMKYSAGKK